MAPQDTGRGDGDVRLDLTARFDATEIGARTAITRIMAGLEHADCAADERAEIEIALAEAVNNVVEHAFAEQPEAEGQITCRIARDAVTLTLTDNGRPLPGEHVPEGRAAPVDGPRQDLPEGGFGWFLIRQLADSVAYRREAGLNRLTLRFLLPQNGRTA